MVQLPRAKLSAAFSFPEINCSSSGQLPVRAIAHFIHRWLNIDEDSARNMLPGQHLLGRCETQHCHVSGLPGHDTFSMTPSQKMYTLHRKPCRNRAIVTLSQMFGWFVMRKPLWSVRGLHGVLGFALPLSCRSLGLDLHTDEYLTAYFRLKENMLCNLPTCAQGLARPTPKWKRKVHRDFPSFVSLGLLVTCACRSGLNDREEERRLRDSRGGRNLPPKITPTKTK